MQCVVAAILDFDNKISIVKSIVRNCRIRIEIKLLKLSLREKVGKETTHQPSTDDWPSWREQRGQTSHDRIRQEGGSHMTISACTWRALVRRYGSKSICCNSLETISAKTSFDQVPQHSSQQPRSVAQHQSWSPSMGCPPFTVLPSRNVGSHWFCSEKCPCQDPWRVFGTHLQSSALGTESCSHLHLYAVSVPELIPYYTICAYYISCKAQITLPHILQTPTHKFSSVVVHGRVLAWHLSVCQRLDDQGGMGKIQGSGPTEAVLPSRDGGSLAQVIGTREAICRDGPRQYAILWWMHLDECLALVSTVDSPESYLPAQVYEWPQSKHPSKCWGDNSLPEYPSRRGPTPAAQDVLETSLEASPSLRISQGCSTDTSVKNWIMKI